LKEQDLLIGKTIYGWTEEETPDNNWYDAFFQVWREKPRTSREMYPAWSTSNDWTGDLMYDMTQSGFKLSFESSQGEVEARVQIGGIVALGHGKTFPQALTKAIEEMSKWDHYGFTHFSEIKRALERT